MGHARTKEKFKMFGNLDGLKPVSTKEQLAEFFHVSVRSISRWVSKGLGGVKLEKLELGGSVRYEKPSVELFVARVKLNKKDG